MAGRFLEPKQPNENNLKEILIKKFNYEIPTNNRLDSRTHAAALDLSYWFNNMNLAFQKEIEKKKRDEKLKDLLPKEEDL